MLQQRRLQDYTHSLTITTTIIQNGDSYSSRNQIHTLRLQRRNIFRRGGRNQRPNHQRLNHQERAFHADGADKICQLCRQRFPWEHHRHFEEVLLPKVRFLETMMLPQDQLATLDHKANYCHQMFQDSPRSTSQPHPGIIQKVLEPEAHPVQNETADLLLDQEHPRRRNETAEILMAHDQGGVPMRSYQGHNNYIMMNQSIADMHPHIRGTWHPKRNLLAGHRHTADVTIAAIPILQIVIRIVPDTSIDTGTVITGTRSSRKMMTTIEGHRDPLASLKAGSTPPHCHLLRYLQVSFHLIRIGKGQRHSHRGAVAEAQLTDLFRHFLHLWIPVPQVIG
jgi:hypothetical protein